MCGHVFVFSSLAFVLLCPCLSPVNTTQGKKKSQAKPRQDKTRQDKTNKTRQKQAKRRQTSQAKTRQEKIWQRKKARHKRKTQTQDQDKTPPTRTREDTQRSRPKREGTNTKGPCDRSYIPCCRSSSLLYIFPHWSLSFSILSCTGILTWLVFPSFLSFYLFLFWFWFLYLCHLSKP